MLPVSHTTDSLDATQSSATSPALDLETHAEPHWQVAWNFAVHACVGSLIFGIIAIPAILLNWSVEWIESIHRTDPAIVLGLRLAEYGIFGSDCSMFLVFLWKSWKRTIRRL